MLFSFTFASKLMHLKSLGETKDVFKKLDEWLSENYEQLYEDENLRAYFLGEKTNSNATSFFAINPKAKKKKSLGDIINSGKEDYMQ